MHPLVRLAKRTVEQYVRSGTVPDPPREGEEALHRRAGVFVCLKEHGRLRGCIGTIEPCTGSAAEETIRNAVSAATRDPRFPQVEEAELEDLEYTVDVLSEPEPVADPAQLDPRRYGVIVSAGPRKGLLLPDLEGVDTVEEQLRIARTKAGIDPGEEKVTIQRFVVQRYT
jgi:AmmeMemoRadiSam system protein A